MQIRVAFYKGRSRLFNRLVSWWTRGPFSHCELVLEDVPGGALCWSASFMDGGIRGKVIDLAPERWEVMTVPATPELRAAASRWFVERNSASYDALGLLGFVWRPIAGERGAWFCSEAVAESLGFVEPWRFDPNTLHAALSRLARA